MIIKTAWVTDKGGRESNDDTVRILHDHNGAWVYVGDGLGGYAGGKQASEAAADALMKICRKDSLLSDENLTHAAELANQAVFKLQRDRKGNMKTTLVFLVIENEQARWVHVGDSRLYHFRSGALKCQTRDHSVSQMAVMMGEITPEEIRFHEDRNRVLRALGGDNARPELSETITLNRGEDAFLLCTDGFWEYVYETEMEDTLALAKDPQQWLDAMLKIHGTRIPEGNDNFTAAVIFC